MKGQAMNLQKTITSFAQKSGIIAGICNATPLDPKQFANFTPFVSGDISKRTTPQKILPTAKTIIAIGVPQKLLENPQLKGKMQISTLGICEDYHIYVKSHLQELANELSTYADFKHKILVDSPTLCERSFAMRAGIGYMGKHGLLISKEFGTRFNIGLLLTSLPQIKTEYENIKTPTRTCPENCNKCITACPTNALSPTAPLDVTRCLSYLTQKKELTPQEVKLMQTQIYGCDICQNVCPKNTPHDGYFIDPKDVAKLDITKTAAAWRGKEILQRNADIVSSNE